jgi:alkylated DNA repair protein (DNA oxidative demethylase)
MRVDVAPGAVWLKQRLTPAEQAWLAEQSLAALDGPAGGYVPTVRGGGKMRVRMVCLGRHWNPATYRYEATRSDYDNAPVAPIPDAWVRLAHGIAADAGFDVTPDICLINWYGEDGRMGLHQDKDETPESLAQGMPVISLSLGDTARFLFGGHRRRDHVETLALESGDAFVFGGPARLRYHGVARVMPRTSPLANLTGRLNLTLRKY